MGPNHYFLQKTQEGILKKATMGFIFLVLNGLLFSQSLTLSLLSLSLIVALFNDPMERTFRAYTQQHNKYYIIQLYSITAMFLHNFEAKTRHHFIPDTIMVWKCSSTVNTLHSIHQTVGHIPSPQFKWRQISVNFRLNRTAIMWIE